MSLKTGIQRLVRSADFSKLASLGHDCDDADIETAGPNAPMLGPINARVQCRLCGTVVWFENPTWRLGGPAQWRLEDESKRHLDQSCHSRRALMLQHYSRIRSLIDEKQGRFRS